MMLDELIAKISAMPLDMRREVEDARAKDKAVWLPNSGPQRQACRSEADELLFGGQAGGGKTDLGIGLALTQHRRTLILRRINKDIQAIVDRTKTIVGHSDGYNGQLQRWHLPDGRYIHFSGVEHEEDKQRFKGDPHDLIFADEAADLTYSQYRFIVGWNRSSHAGQRCRVVCASNPPTTAEGLWLIKHWSPWLDMTHPKPALPGELRWYTTDAGGADIEVDGRGPHVVRGFGQPVLARSRTFIPSRLEDNPDLARTDYKAVLAGLPAELRAAYMEGRFDAIQKDQAFQCIPTPWIVDAMNRWIATGWKEFAMTAMAIDPAGGGGDAQVIAMRHGGWYAPMVAETGMGTADGARAVSSIIRHRRDNAPIVIDVGGGYGGGVLMRLKENGLAYYSFNASSTSTARSKDGQLRFINARAEAWWRMREELDPEQIGGSAVALPPDAELKADLAAPTYEVTARGIKIESKEDLRARLGRSPDKGDAVTMCMSCGNAARRSMMMANTPMPKVILGHPGMRRRR